MLDRTHIAPTKTLRVSPTVHPIDYSVCTLRRHFGNAYFYLRLLKRVSLTLSKSVCASCISLIAASALSTSSTTTHTSAWFEYNPGHFRSPCDRHFQPYQQQPANFRARRSRSAPLTDSIATSGTCASAQVYSHVVHPHLDFALMLGSALIVERTWGLSGASRGYG
jgi:hypothetical protein